MRFANEIELERYVRKLIADHVTREEPGVYALDNKNAVDIVVCRDGPTPAVLLIEIKYHQVAHGRLGFGGGSGGGIQPEIVRRQPLYFEQNLRWILGSETHSEGLLFLPSCTIRRYVSGGSVGKKFNNIRHDIFKEERLLTEAELVFALHSWLVSTPTAQVANH